MLDLPKVFAQKAPPLEKILKLILKFTVDILNFYSKFPLIAPGKLAHKKFLVIPLNFLFG